MHTIYMFCRESVHPPAQMVHSCIKARVGGWRGPALVKSHLGVQYLVHYTGCNTLGATQWVQYTGCNTLGAVNTLCYCSIFPLALTNVAHTTFSLNKRPFRANTVPQRKFCKICVCCQIFAKQKIPCKKKKKITLNDNYQDVIWNIGIWHCCVFRKDKSLLEVLINLE